MEKIREKTTDCFLSAKYCVSSEKGIATRNSTRKTIVLLRPVLLL